MPCTTTKVSRGLVGDRCVLTEELLRKSAAKRKSGPDFIIKEKQNIS